MISLAQIKTQVRSGIRVMAVLLERAPTIPLVIISAMLIIAIFASCLAPHSPYDISLPNKLKPPFWTGGDGTIYLLGTDTLGRDNLSRLIFGARMSLMVAVAALLLAGFVGTALGLVAGFQGGKLDVLIMRAADMTFAFPVILLALLLAVVLGPKITNLIIIIILVLWARYARIVRAEVLIWKEREFVEYARVVGASSLKIMVRHLLPNVVNTVMVLGTFQAGSVIIMEASLSYLGAGVPPPIPSWGGMVAAGRDYIATAWWVSLFPGLCIVLVVLSLNLFGDWLRDYLDPKLRQI